MCELDDNELYIVPATTLFYCPATRNSKFISIRKETQASTLRRGSFRARCIRNLHQGWLTGALNARLGCNRGRSLIKSHQQKRARLGFARREDKALSETLRAEPLPPSPRWPPPLVPGSPAGAAGGRSGPSGPGGGVGGRRGARPPKMAAGRPERSPRGPPRQSPRRASRPMGGRRALGGADVRAGAGGGGGARRVRAGFR